MVGDRQEIVSGFEGNVNTTAKELEERTRELGVEGRSKMNKDELIDALRNR